MGIEVKIKIDLKKEMQKIDAAITKAATAAIALERTEIVARTGQGIDADGNAFTPYSPKYSDYRARKGRQRSPVNLNFTGQMLQSIASEGEQTASGFEGRIYFRSPAMAQRAEFNQRLRRFFDLSKQQIKRITDEISNAIKRAT